MTHIQFYGSRKKLLLALWVMFGCFFVALNVFAFFSVYENPIPDPSREVKTARMKYSQYNAQQENTSDDIGKEAWRIFMERFGKTSRTKIGNKASQQKIIKTAPSYDPVVLPTLSGILRIAANDHATFYLAVLNGKSCVEEESIDGFRIKTISEENVVLERNGRMWTVDAPNVKYSVSHDQ